MLDKFKDYFDFVKMSNQHKEYYDFEFSMVNDDFYKNTTYLVLNGFFSILNGNQEERIQFVGYVHKKYGNSIGMFGYGNNGKQICEILPELKLNIIFDNSIEQFLKLNHIVDT